MKIQCPECKADYTFPDDKIPEKGMRARCMKCGTIMVVRKGSGDISVTPDISVQDASKVQSAGQGAESPIPLPESQGGLESVISQSPKYPKYRDRLIYATAAVLFVLILGAGYVVFKGKDLSFFNLSSFKIPGNPIVAVLRLFGEGAAYDACGTFVQKNEAIFPSLGENIRISLIRQEVKSDNRGKIARVVVGAVGAKASGQIYFQLRKEGDVWRITTAALRVGGGKYQNVYPPNTSKTGGKS